MSLFDDDLASIMADAATIGAPSITIAATDYACEPAQADAMLAPALEGEMSDISATVLVPAHLFTAGAEPVEGAKAKYDGKFYRVASVQKSVDALEYQLGLAPIRR